MDKLDAQQLAAVKKTSSALFVAKLAKAGMSEEELESLSREQLMAKWAEMLVAGVRTKEEPAVVALTTATIEIERERLQFEREKWQAEITARQSEREEELSRRAWERQREDEEREERRQFEEARFKQEEVRIALMIEANKLQSASVGKENTKVESVTFKLKQYGDALRHSLFKMADNPLELVSFFDSVDRLFLELKVPSELQVNLFV